MESPLISIWCKGCGEHLTQPMTKEDIAIFNRVHREHGLVGLHQEMQTK